jgi:hypothetical protein
MSHVISMHRPGDPRQTAFRDLFNVILYLLTPRFEHSTLVVRAKQLNHSAIAAVKELKTLIEKLIIQGKNNVKYAF